MNDSLRKLCCCFGDGQREGGGPQNTAMKPSSTNIPPVVPNESRSNSQNVLEHCGYNQPNADHQLPPQRPQLLQRPQYEQQIVQPMLHTRSRIEQPGQTTPYIVQAAQTSPQMTSQTGQLSPYMARHPQSRMSAPRLQTRQSNPRQHIVHLQPIPEQHSMNSQPSHGSPMMAPLQQLNQHSTQANNLTEEQTAEYREAFTMFDKNGEGRIALTELGTVIKALGHNPTDEELDAVVQSCHSDGSATIDFQEFLAVMAMLQATFSEEDLIASFLIFDRNQDGFITKDELKFAMINLGEDMTDEEIEEMIRTGDVDEDGKLNMQEFVQMMASR